MLNVPQIYYNNEEKVTSTQNQLYELETIRKFFLARNIIRYPTAAVEIEGLTKLLGLSLIQGPAPVPGFNTARVACWAKIGGRCDIRGHG